MSVYKNRGRSSGRIRKSIKNRKVKTITKNGFTFTPNLSKIDLKDAPSIYRPYAGEPEQVLDKIEKRRSDFIKTISGKGGVRVKFAAPKFGTRRTKSRYHIKRRGRLRETYYFFPVFRFAVIQQFDAEPQTPADVKRVGAIDNYDVLKRYFSNVQLGARAAWTPRPPTILESFTGEYNIRQTLGSFRKHGLNKAALRKVIKSVESRLMGYAVITGINGVWRSERSEQYSFRAAGRRADEAGRHRGERPRKAKRSKYKKGRS